MSKVLGVHSLNGAVWGNEGDVALSMSNFLEKRFVSDRLTQLAQIVDRR